MKSTSVWNSCLELVWFLFSWSYIWKIVGIFPLVWITSMDISWNPCLCKGFILPWDYLPFGSHFWLCRGPRDCLVAKMRFFWVLR